MFCTQCGSKISDTSNFCIKCGAQVKNPVQVPLPQVYHTEPPAAPSVRKNTPIVNPMPKANSSLPVSSSSGRGQPQKSKALPIILIAGGVFAAGLVIVAVIIAAILIGGNILDSDSYSGAEYYQTPQYDDNNDIFIEDPFVEDPFAEDPFAEDPFAYDGYDSEYPADDYVITDQQDTCISCYGSGYCDDCNGTGQYSMYGNPLDTCPSCDGDGICSICDGLGYY